MEMYYKPTIKVIEDRQVSVKYCKEFQEQNMREMAAALDPEEVEWVISELLEKGRIVAV